jgi:hypothetical protein
MTSQIGRNRITEVTRLPVRLGAARGKISTRSSVRRLYETNRCFPASARLELRGFDAGSGSNYESRAKCSPISQNNEEAGEDDEEGQQESGEGATESKQAGESSSELAFGVDVGLGFRRLKRFPRDLPLLDKRISCATSDFNGLPKPALVVP